MKIIVCLGTGGVGKTSIAASIGLARALGGARCLVLTADPALRLRTALGLKDGLLEQRVPVESAAGELWGALLDVNATLDEAVRLYAKPADKERILGHPVYRAIANSLSGMQELMAIERLDQLIRAGFDNIVIDTAATRHALDLFDKPAFFADLADSEKVKFVSRTYKIAEAMGLTAIGRAALEVYRRAESIIGADLVKEILDFYSLFYPVAEGYSARARKTVALLRNPEVTEFRIVTTPGKALRDTRFFMAELRKRDFAAGMICVNRTWPDATPPPTAPGPAAEILEWYSSVSSSQRRAVETMRQALALDAMKIRIISELENDVEGVESLRLLAEQIEPAVLSTIRKQ